MFNNFSKNSFKAERLVFLTEKPSGESESVDDIISKAASEGAQKLEKENNVIKPKENILKKDEVLPKQKSAIEKGIEEAQKSAKKEILEESKKNREKLRIKTDELLLPKLSKTPQGILISKKAETAKVNDDRGTIEEPFKSNDGKIEGNVSLPLKANPDQRTTIVVHFCEDPSKADPEFLNNLAKQKDKLGNTVVINLKTPEGATIEINQKTHQQVDALRTIISDVEKYQQEYYQDKNKKLPRALSILPFTEPDQAKKTIEFLKKSRENAQLEKFDRRLIKYQNLYRTDDFQGEINQMVEDLNRPLLQAKFRDELPQKKVLEKAKTTTPRQLIKPAAFVSSKQNFQRQESLNPAPSNYLEQQAANENAKSKKVQSTSFEQNGNIPEQPAIKLAPGQEPKVEELKLAEKLGSIYGKTGFFGDSILNQFNHSKKSYEWDMPDGWMKKSYGGKTSAYLLNKLKTSSDSDFKGLKQAVILIGTNDIGGMDQRYTAKAIEKRIREIHQFFLDKGIQVFACTIPPFKGHTFSTYKTHYDEVNEKRKEINQFIRSEQGVTVIPLDNTEENGGLSSDSDPDRISKDYKGKMDWVHPSPYPLGKLIESHLKLHLSGRRENILANLPESTETQHKIVEREYGKITILKNGDSKWPPEGKNPWGIPNGCRRWPKQPTPEQKAIIPQMRHLGFAMRADQELNAPGQQNEITVDGITLVGQMEWHPPVPEVNHWHRDITFYLKNELPENTEKKSKIKEKQFELPGYGKLNYFPESPELYAFAKQQNNRLIAEGKPYGYTEEAEFNGEKVLLRHTLHHLKGSTGATGNFAATEVFKLS